MQLNMVPSLWSVRNAGDDRSILERVRLYKELKQYADHIAALDEALLDTLDMLEPKAPFGVEQLGAFKYLCMYLCMYVFVDALHIRCMYAYDLSFLIEYFIHTCVESSRRIHTNLDEKLEFVLLTNEDAAHDGVSEANLHRLNPRVAELNRLPHTYNAVLIAASLAAKDFIMAAQAHDNAAVKVAPQELDLLRERVVAYKELERHNYLLSQASLDFMNTVKRYVCVYVYV